MDPFIIVIAGKNDIAVQLMEWCVDRFGTDRVVCILTRNDKGINTWQKSLKYFCEKDHVRIITMEEAYELDHLIFLSAEFDRILHIEKFRTDKLFNIHFSLLPEYKGMYPSVLPILHGRTETGVTLHVMDNGIDTGGIIDQRRVPISPEDSSLDLYRKLSKEGYNLVTENFDRLISGDYPVLQQRADHSTYFAPNEIDYRNLKLDLRKTAFQVCNQVRAFAFRPYQLLTFKGYGLIGCKITEEVSSEKPGTILEDNEVFFRVSTIDYNVILYKDILKELFEAIRNKDQILAKSLCECSKILQDQGEHGWSPLTVAVYYANVEMMEYLIKRGADVHLLNYNGTNLLMYAKDAYLNTHDSRPYRFLKDLGLNEYAKDYKDRNLYDYLEKDGISLSEIL